MHSGKFAAGLRRVLTPAILTAVFVAPTIFGADDPRQPRGPLLTVKTHFAKLLPSQPPCADLELFDVSLPTDVDADARTALRRKLRTDYEAQAKTVTKYRLAADKALEELRLAGVNSVRQVVHGGPVDQAKASGDLVLKQLVWILLGRGLEAEVRELHDLAKRYYDAFEGAFLAASDAEHKRILEGFEKRLRCLHEKRRAAFAARDKHRRTSQQRFKEEFEKATREPAPGQFTPRPTPADLAPSVDALIGDPALQSVYLWIVGEIDVHLGLYSRLLALKAQHINNTQLHPELVEAQESAPRVPPRNPLPESNAAAELRMEIFRLRARRAAVSVVRSETQIELAVENAASTLLGLQGAADEAWKSIGTKLESLRYFEVDDAVDVTDVESFARAYQQFTDEVGRHFVDKTTALIAIGGKFLGSSLGLLVLDPVKNFFVENAGKPLGGLFGVEVENSVEKAYRIYKEQLVILDGRLKLLEALMSYTPDQAQGFIRSLRNVETRDSSGSVFSQAKGIATGMLEDAEFISVTQGGLPGIFSILCADPADHIAVLLAGAEYQLAGNAKAAYSRITTSRSFTPEDVGPRLTGKLVQRLVEQTKPVEYASGFFANAWIFYDNSWSIAKSVANPFKILSLARNRVEYSRGNSQDQDQYLTRAVALQSGLGQLRRALKDVDYDYAALAAGNQEVWKKHVELKADSYEYVDAWRRLRDAHEEREKIRIWAKYGREENNQKTLSPAGKWFLATTNGRQRRESSRLATDTAWQRLRYLALTSDYRGASVQVKELEQLEEQRRRLHSLKPEDIDLSRTEHAFRDLVVRDDVFLFYDGLYQSVLWDAAVSMVSAGLGNVFLDKLSKAGMVRLEPLQKLATSTVVKQRLWNALNPWAGKFSASGIFGIVKGKAIEAVRESTAQIVAKKQNVFSEKQVDTFLDAVVSITDDAYSHVSDAIARSDVDWQADGWDNLARNRIAEEAERDIDRHTFAGNLAEADVARARRLAALGESAASDDRSRAILQAAKQQAAKAVDEIVRQRNDEITREGAANAPADVRRRRIEDGAKREAVALLLGRLKEDTVSGADLRRFLDPDLPLPMRDSLFQEGLDVATLRRATTSALRNDTSRENTMDALTASLMFDEMRRRKVQDSVQEFHEGGGWREKGVELVVTASNAGNPDDPGLLGDFELQFVVTKPGVSEDEVRRAFDEFAQSKGYRKNGFAPLGVRSSVQTLEAYGANRALARRRGKAAPWTDTQRFVTNERVTPLELDTTQLDGMETQQGFRRDHAQRLQEFAELHDLVIIMRNGNPQSVRFFDDPNLVPKAQSSKAKTAKAGWQDLANSHLGMVVDPTHGEQVKFFNEDVAAAKARGDTKTVESLTSARNKALETWSKYGAGMLQDGYRVHQDTGVIEQAFEGPDGETVWKGVHGDYDLHGVYKKMPDGSFQRVSFGDGTPGSNNTQGVFRIQLNEWLNAGLPEGVWKDMVQHGGQDDWEYALKSSDPPVTVFCTPELLPSQDGGLYRKGDPPKLGSPEEMRLFYEGILRVRWEYGDGFGDLSVAGGKPIKTPPSALRWKRNLGALRALPGSMEPPAWTPVFPWMGYSLALEMAPRLDFLTDPRLAPATLEALTDADIRDERIRRALAQSVWFVHLVDAWVISDLKGNQRYNTRQERLLPTGPPAPPPEPGLEAARRRAEALLGDLASQPITGPKAATIDDAASLVGGSTPLDAGDLDTLRRLVRLQQLASHTDPWAVPGVEKPLEIWKFYLPWLRRKAASLYAAIGTHWFREFERMSLDASTAEEEHADQELARIVALLERAMSSSTLGAGAFMQPPIRARGTWADGLSERELTDRLLADIDAADKGRQEEQRLALEAQDAVKARFASRTPPVAASPEEFASALGEELANRPGPAAARAATFRTWIQLYNSLRGIAP